MGTWQDVTDESVRDNSAPVARGGNATVNSYGGFALALLALVVSCVTLGMVLELPNEQRARVDVLSEQSNKAEREARVMQERWNDLKVELAKRGIPVSDH